MKFAVGISRPRIYTTEYCSDEDKFILTLPHKRTLLWLLAALVLTIPGCGGGGGAERSPPIIIEPPAPPPPPPPVQIKLDGFTALNDSQWDTLAVRKVLHAFAYGGQSTDAQIQSWADMDPSAAIMQMLTFAEHNELLSPPSPADTDGLVNRPANLRTLAAFWTSSDPANGVPAEIRSQFDFSTGGGWIEHLWPMATTMRGLNAFRQRIAYWEVYHHLAVNLNAGIQVKPLLRYYDEIAESLERGDSYDAVLATAARSAAIAIQYGHYRNRYVDGACQCNEDFAREFYQLFFGILGQDDPHYHETVTIKNTASALTGMNITRESDGGFTDEISYDTEFHYPAALEVMGQSIDGTHASERIDRLTALAIDHPESLANLPVMIISGLADDNLTAAKIAKLRRAWADMPEKDLLLFLRAYAISDLFHSAERVKYLSTLDRRLLIATKLSSANEEIYQRVYSVIAHLLEGVQTFRPIDNVFGGQTGLMAASSAEVFRVNYNQATEHGWAYRRSSFGEGDYTWTKDWRDIIPATSQNDITAAVAAEWLWNHLLADNGKNLGALERAHLYALLAQGEDLAYLVDPDNPDAVYSESDVQSNAAIVALLNDLANQPVGLHNADPASRERANANVGQAVNFITATPYIFYQEGR